MRNVQLSINPKPPLVSYLQHAYAFAILATDQKYLPWLYSNYIQLYCPEDLSVNPNAQLNFFNSYFFLGTTQGIKGIKTQGIKRGLIAKNYKGGVQQFVIDNLSIGRYVYTWVDEFDIHIRPSYQRNHFFHDLLIYGYDLDKQIFHTLGYGKDRIFGAQEIPFHELRSMEVTFPHWDVKILILEKDDEQLPTEIDLPLIKLWLSEYLESTDSSQRYKPFELSFSLTLPAKHDYGLKIYEIVLDFLEYLKTHGERADIRPFHLLMEHKQIMTQRIRYLEAGGYLEGTELSTRQSELEKCATALRNSMMKFYFTRNNALLTHAQEKLKWLAEQESELFHTLLQRL